ncbi:MAG: hypothetical protein EOO74_08560, partial [Myxococcales bacterium]
ARRRAPGRGAPGRRPGLSGGSGGLVGRGGRAPGAAAGRPRERHGAGEQDSDDGRRGRLDRARGRVAHGATRLAPCMERAKRQCRPGARVGVFSASPPAPLQLRGEGSAGSFEPRGCRLPPRSPSPRSWRGGRGVRLTQRPAPLPARYALTPAAGP